MVFTAAFRLFFLPRPLFDGLLERFMGAVGVPSSIGDVMVLQIYFLQICFFTNNVMYLLFIKKINIGQYAKLQNTSVDVKIL